MMRGNLVLNLRPAVLLSWVLAIGVCLGSTSCPAGDCEPGTIITIAGGVGDGAPAAEADLRFPRDVAVGPDGVVYILDSGNRRVRAVDRAGIIRTVAGNGETGLSGDGGPARQAALGPAAEVAIGPDGSIYIALESEHRVRKVDPAGIITTLAGTGEERYSGDGGPASQARLDHPNGIAVAADGSVYIADSRNHRVRKVDGAGVITTVAGTGEKGYSGDGGPADRASVSPGHVGLDAEGNLYISGDWRIRRVDREGIITTIAGNGKPGFQSLIPQAGGRALEVGVSPTDLAVGRDGAIYFTHWLPSHAYRLDRDGWVRRVAGSRQIECSGDGGPALEAALSRPEGLAVGPDGALYIAAEDHRVRKVDTQGIITTFAGTDRDWSGGDGRQAVDARLAHPRSIAIGSDGTVFIADSRAGRVRKVDPTGVITTVAGGGGKEGAGDEGFAGDGGPAVQARLHSSSAVALDKHGALYIADGGNNRVRKVDPAGGITTIAGDGWNRGDSGHTGRYAGDGGPATEASLNYPFAVTVADDGSVYIADMHNHRVRKIDPAGIITTVAGDGRVGFAGDGGPATEAALDQPSDVAIGPDGALYIADAGNRRIRRVDERGTITTVAGNGEDGDRGDGGLATRANLMYPRGVAFGPDGCLYIADSGNHRVRKVCPVMTWRAAIITTIAGGRLNPTTIAAGFSGEGGPAVQAHLAEPGDVAVAADGTIYIADSSNRRIRKICAGAD